MKHVVSISLGSSTRNKSVVITLDGEPIRIERVGTDGDEAKARRLFEELDGKVDALGVGGVELYLRLEGREYPLRSGLSLVKNVRQTPCVDGRGLKHTLERRVFELATPALGFRPHYRQAFMTLGVDRFGMAQAVAEVSDRVVYGDLMFALGLPIPITSLRQLRVLARLLLPVIGLLPVSMLYPTGEKQEQITPKYPRYWAAAELIAGDFLYIRKHLPDDLHGKTILTNTTTEQDVELLRQRGLRWLITTTPRYEGRSFGTNMMEAALTAYAGKGRVLTEAELNELIDRLQLRPSVQRLNE
ncbi:MAG: quinate 5-dehydrogenase [Anaerolineae bacterium]|nr:hypothetical protein [Caldilineales bacterium]MDW8269713.1 quinate 5-dehydrogenase [Anaerolineae bacterium]